MAAFQKQRGLWLRAPCSSTSQVSALSAATDSGPGQGEAVATSPDPAETRGEQVYNHVWVGHGFFSFKTVSCFMDREGLYE